jgi:hypothetical protein
MNTRGLLVAMFAVAVGVAPQLVSTSNAADTYSAQPTANGIQKLAVAKKSEKLSSHFVTNLQ